MNRKCYFVGITGSIGSGKTTVSNILREYGYSVFDTDLLSKQILIEEKSIAEIIENIVGQNISNNKKIDFKKVGEIFDNNPDLEEKYEDWYQVFLGEKIIEKKLTLENERGIFFFDVPLLNQKGIADEFDYLWVIESNETILYERIKNRNNYTNDKIKYLVQNSRIDKELLLSRYKNINNSNSIEDLKVIIKSELDNLILNLEKDDGRTIRDFSSKA